MPVGSSESLPIPLSRILESESIRLSGADATANPLEACWSVTEDDIIDPRAIVDRLISADPKPPFNAPPGARIERKALAEELNRLLETLWAQKLWLSSFSSFQLDLAQYVQLSPPDRFPSDDAFNLNRHMLDIVCRGGLKSAYDTTLAKVIDDVHEQSERRPRTALCISGGGIRSATFALGVLQGLAERRLLSKFDFLSTVSGGGYIGGWLSSWIRRNPFGLRGVEEQLQLRARPDARIDPEPEPIRHLREYSNYLTPKLGALSADTWTLIGIYLRNVLLNWLVLIPLLVSVLAVPRLMTAAVLSSASIGDLGILHAKDLWTRILRALGRQPLHLTIDQKTYIAVAIGALALILAFVYLVGKRPVSEHEDQNARLTNGDFIRKCIVPLFVAAISVNLAWAWYRTDPRHAAPQLGWFVTYTLITGGVAWAVYRWRSSHTVHARSLRDEEDFNRRMQWELLSTTASSMIAGILFWLCARWIFPDPVSPLPPKLILRWPLDQHAGLSAVSEWYVCFGVPLVFFILFLQCSLFVGFSSHRNEDYDREWWARASAWVLIAGLGWSALSLMAIFGPVGIYLLPKTISALGGGAGLFALMAGRSEKTSAKADEATLKDRAVSMALALAVPLFLLTTLAAISLGTTEIVAKMNRYHRTEGDKLRMEAARAALTERRMESAEPAKHLVTHVIEKPIVDITEIRSLEHLEIVHQTDPVQAILVIVGALAVGLAFSFCIGVNAFSMHSMYRNRLIRAYLGASRGHRRPNLFTGFDPQDNLDLHVLRPEMLWAHSFVDFDTFVRALAGSKGSTEKSSYAFLWSLLDAAGSQPVLEQFATHGRHRREAREVLFANINALLDRRDFEADWARFQSGQQMTRSDHPDPLRSFQNRHFLDEHFTQDIYPHPMPLLCPDDIVDRAAFLKRTSRMEEAKDIETLDEAIAFINQAIRTKDLGKEKPFDHDSISPKDRAPFTPDPSRPLHRFLENRLLVDKLFGDVVAPLLPSRPMHVVNAALNLVGGENLGWQERKAESFTFTPQSSGSIRLGYRETKDYGGITLGTAVTISGAAASPNMGYHSSPALALLMMLFNVRLGWWLGNPGVAGNRTFRRKHPASSIAPLVNEAVANTNDRYKYVYLSDGGHFDNLGLYEMVLRRCHDIVVSDAGADEEFRLEDLGNAIRKIRIDLGIRITIDRFALFPRKSSGKKGYCAVGKIHYGEVDGGKVTGNLLYIKPAFYEAHEEVPKDIYNYARQNPNFPHQSTADQFFSESQFESYRALGAFAVEQICPKADLNGNFAELFEQANAHLDSATGL